MSEQSYSIDQDLKEASAMTDGLDSYVLSNELYGGSGSGGIFGGGRMPSLTIGGLLMRLRRLKALRGQMTPAQQQQLAGIETKHDALRKEWLVHYNQKMLREANSRLDMLNRYFEDCKQEPRSCAGNYGPEALRRTIVEDIARAAEDTGVDSGDLHQRTRLADSHLRRYAQTPGFVWDAALQAAYPQDDYWWLWMHPENASKKK